MPSFVSRKLPCPFVSVTTSVPPLPRRSVTLRAMTRVALRVTPVEGFVVEDCSKPKSPLKVWPATLS